ncbi:MAG: hypothetical protein JO091_11450 [Acidobacteriaceae bacterium]|nr:hypothetical protein [Acidobacteriaceae bacterium]
MGFGIELKDEWGAQLDTVADPQNILDRLLPVPGDSSNPMLGSIDPYGDTVFNVIQINWFLSEWSAVLAKAQTAEEQELTSKITAMAQRVRDGIGLYLKFVGD